MFKVSLPNFPFRYEVGDLLLLPPLGHIKGLEAPTVLVVESPQDDTEAYTVFDFSINEYRHVTPGSYVDRHSKRIE